MTQRLNSTPLLLFGPYVKGPWRRLAISRQSNFCYPRPAQLVNQAIARSQINGCAFASNAFARLAS